MKNRLREVREEKGISQEELSEKSGVSRTTISELETEKKRSYNKYYTRENCHGIRGKSIEYFFYQLSLTW